MKWLLLLIVDPIKALDLSDRSDGGVDHGKVIGFFTYMTMLGVLGAHVFGFGGLLPLGHTIALISTAYGWAGWRTFLASKAATATEQVERTEKRVEKDIEERYPYGPPTQYIDDD